MSLLTARSLLQPVAWLMLPAAMCNSPLRAETPADLTVRTLDYSGVDAATLNRAQSVAGAALHQAGIRVEWLNCPVAVPGASATDACEVRVSDAANLELVILPRHMAATISRSPGQFGFAVLTREGRFPKRAYLFLHRVIDYAKDGMVSWKQLLGPMVAHEIGHLLLGTNSHSRVGVMCAQWGPGEIEGALMGTLTFTREQSARMRLDVQRRHDVR